jgi:hypothetical protein|uniref:Uncharacterized protein n=1 Tax=Zea mays TaxID=4577 RepID=A0A804PDR5_MAIZE
MAKPSHYSRRRWRGRGSSGRCAARRAGGAASPREPELDASRVEAVAADRHDAHGVPVCELGQADGTLRRGARQLGPGRGVNQGWRGRGRGRLHGQLLRVGDVGVAVPVPLPGAGAGATAPSSAAATEEVAHGGVERQGERQRGQQGGQDDGHVAGKIAGAGVGPPPVGGDAARGGRAGVGVPAVGLGPVAKLMVVDVDLAVLGLPLRRHRHGRQATTDLGAWLD